MNDGNEMEEGNSSIYWPALRAKSYLHPRIKGKKKCKFLIAASEIGILRVNKI